MGETGPTAAAHRCSIDEFRPRGRSYARDRFATAGRASRIGADVVRRDHPRPARGAARGAPPRADRLLLPDARLAVRGRGRRAGDAAAGVAELRPLRGPRGAALVALPDRDERLPRHAERPGAPRAPDGP